MERSNVYPYLVPDLSDPELESIAVPVGHGVHATLVEDHQEGRGIVHVTLRPKTLQASGLSAGELHRIALDNLVRFATTETEWGLTTRVIGKPGDPVHYLLICEHPRAAACLRLPGLYEQSRELLHANELCACVPQRKSLVVLPRRDRRFRKLIVDTFREIEVDARRPISFELFELTMGGVLPLFES